MLLFFAVVVVIDVVVSQFLMATYPAGVEQTIFSFPFVSSSPYSFPVDVSGPLSLTFSFVLFVPGVIYVGAGSVDREISGTFELVVRAGNEYCGVNTTGGGDVGCESRVIYVHVNLLLAALAVKQQAILQLCEM